MSKTVKIIVSLLLVASLVLSFSAGCALANRALPSAKLSPPDVVEEAWNIIFQNYVDRDKLDAGVLSQAAIKGMVVALDDPYTSYLDARHYQVSLDQLEGGFEGIGAFVGIKDGQIMIIAPFANSPAARAGIRAGDLILAIDGNSTEGMSVGEAVLGIRGAKGTAVRLLIQHQGETEPVEIEIVRAEIELPSTYFEMKADIAYININAFTEHTNEELSPVLEGIAREEATGIVLDLRNNPGGLLDEVVDVTGRFLSTGVVLYVVDNQGERTSRSVESGGDTTALPMVILVNSYTASGGEVLAGALQDHARATVAGTKTYGKGSVNVLYRLQDGSGLYLTTARWLTPDGRLIEGEGISPDYELDLEGEAAIQWAIDYLKGQKREKVGRLECLKGNK